MNAYEFIKQYIELGFHDLAEEASKMDLSEEELVGIPMTLFVAESALLEFWKHYTNTQAAVVKSRQP